MEKENEKKKIWKKISSGKKSHNRVSPQQFACDWIRSKKFLTIGYQDTNRVQTLYMYTYTITYNHISIWTNTHGGINEPTRMVVNWINNNTTMMEYIYILWYSGKWFYPKKQKDLNHHDMVLCSPCMNHRCWYSTWYSVVFWRNFDDLKGRTAGKWTWHLIYPLVI